MMQFFRRLRSLLSPRSRGGVSGRLSTEASACLPVLDVLESQISDAMQTATNATDDLSSSFGDMATQARTVVNQASQPVQDGSESGVDQVREVVSVLLAQVRRTNDSAAQIAEMLGTIETDLQDVELCMTQIEDVANKSRMVSLNGQIEAARAGEHGQGFSVVATETGDLATSVTDTSQRIRSVVDRLTNAVHSTTEQTRLLVEADQVATSKCEERVGGMLTELETYQRNLEYNLESTKSSSDQLASAITRSIITLQFQDAVSQRMNHVAETISEIRETFGCFVKPAKSGVAKRRTDEWMDRLTSSYCVADEHLVHSGESASEITEPASSNIELF